MTITVAPIKDEALVLEPELVEQKENNEVLAKESHKIQELETNLEEIKKQHLQMAKLLQVESIRAMKENRARIFKWKDAMESLKTGIELERKILGLDEENTAPIVNIIATNKGVISKYVEEEEEDDKED